jgi:hypothetical protein
MITMLLPVDSKTAWYVDECHDCMSHVIKTSLKERKGGGCVEGDRRKCAARLAWAKSKLTANDSRTNLVALLRRSNLNRVLRVGVCVCIASA